MDIIFTFIIVLNYLLHIGKILNLVFGLS